MTLAQLPATRYHQGWAYSYHPDNGARTRWVAARRGQTLRSSTEAGLKTLIESAIDSNDNRNRDTF